MNEAETRAELINPKLESVGWGIVEDSKILRERNVCEKEPPESCPKFGQSPCICPKKVKIKLRDGKDREIQHMIATSFWSADGKPISAEEFLNNLFGELPNFFKNEEELRTLWSNPVTRKTLLEKLDEAGFGRDELNTLKKLIDAEKSDLYETKTA